MAIKVLEDIRQEAVFGRKLFSLGEDMNMIGTSGIAEGLYENNECYKLLKPGGRPAKYLINRKKDIDTISRRVLDHLDFENPYDVPGNYMLAYSILFDCSLDYLYGRIEEKCPNVEVLDISKKTGLSVEAVKRLMGNEEVCMEEWLQTADRYGLLYASPSADLDDDDESINTYASVTEFWSQLIESDLFSSLPEDFYRMACALYTSKGVKMVAEDARKSWDELPDLETFLSWVHTWETFHPDKPLFAIEGLADDEISEFYKQDPNLVKQIYREIRYNHFYSSVEKAEEYETAYWGCAGKFDRQTLDFFHKKSEEWCKTGTLPSFEV